MINTALFKRLCTVSSFALTSTLLVVLSTSCANSREAPPHSNLLKEANIDANSRYAFGRCRSLQARPFNKSSKKKKLIIIGDSQGCDFLNSMAENNYLNNYQIQFRFIPYACQKVPNENIDNYISPKHKDFCLNTGRLDNLKKAKQQVKEANVIVFAALWKPKVANKLPKIFNYLGITKQQRLVVVGHRFFGKVNINKYAKSSNDERRSARVGIGKTSLKINAILKRRLAKDVIFVNPHKLICGTKTSCPIFTSDFTLISYDGRHLTKAGARYMGKILFHKSGLKVL